MPPFYQIMPYSSLKYLSKLYKPHNWIFRLSYITDGCDEALHVKVAFDLAPTEEK